LIVIFIYHAFDVLITKGGEKPVQMFALFKKAKENRVTKRRLFNFTLSIAGIKTI